MKCHQCGQSGLKGKKGLAMHIGRVHTRIIKTYKRPRGHRLSMNGVDSEHTGGVAVAEPVALTRRRVKPVFVPSKLSLQQFNVNGCPNCLFPLKIMNDALEQQGIPLPPYCPVCTMPVEIVRTSLRVIDKQTQAQPA